MAPIVDLPWVSLIMYASNELIKPENSIDKIFSYTMQNQEGKRIFIL